jgi:hypothetical protein
MCDDEKPIDDAVAFWRGNKQRPVSWSRDRWIDRLGERAVFKKLPDQVGRRDVVDVFAGVSDEESATDAFIAAMVWGFGQVGYGAWRTQRILEKNDRVGARLLAIAKKTAGEGGVAGFEEVSEAPLKYLGVAFGTKFLFFAAEASPEKVAAPVLDRIICSWLADNLGCKLDISSWRRSQDYRRYCDKLAEWAFARDMTPGQVEEALFEYATRRPEPPRDAEVADLLEALALVVDRSSLAQNDKAVASFCLESLTRLLEAE